MSVVKNVLLPEVCLLTCSTIKTFVNKGHMGKTKGGIDQGWEWGWLGWGENGDNCTWTTTKKWKEKKTAANGQNVSL